MFLQSYLLALLWIHTYQTVALSSYIWGLLHTSPLVCPEGHQDLPIMYIKHSGLQYEYELLMVIQ